MCSTGVQKCNFSELRNDGSCIQIVIVRYLNTRLVSKFYMKILFSVCFSEMFFSVQGIDTDQLYLDTDIEEEIIEFFIKEEIEVIGDSE